MFDLKKTVELRCVAIGFLVFNNDSTEMVSGLPSSVLLEGGMNLETLNPLSCLEEIPDHCYHFHGVGVFAKNFAR